MDVETAETTTAGTGIKFDSHSTGSNLSSTALEGAVIDDKQDAVGSSSGKIGIAAESNGQKSLINDESLSIQINRSPKTELQFRNDNSSAINRTIILDSEVPVVADSDSVEVEIKQEVLCPSPNLPLPPHAMCKIQVCILN